jgi:hypothetical protein
MYNVNIKFGQVTVEDLLQKWSLIPDSKSKVYPDYIPIALRNDYKEACLILDLSPKASATLSRRCVQGIIRDFWGISKSTLYDEISALEDQLDPLLWESINAVRSIGNIGAHMEKDINLIIDVDSKEAYFLIELIELLFKEWYILRYERKLKLESLVEIANKKKVAKNSKT